MSGNTNWNALSKEQKEICVKLIQSGQISSKTNLNEITEQEDLDNMAKALQIAKRNLEQQRDELAKEELRIRQQGEQILADARREAELIRQGTREATPSVSNDFQAAVVGGQRYFINRATGYAYYRNPDGTRGRWAGLFVRTPRAHIDETVREPIRGGRRRPRRKTQKVRKILSRKH